MNTLIQETDIKARTQFVGGKAKGLIKLKSLESQLGNYDTKVAVPPFFVVPSDFDLFSNYKMILCSTGRLGSETYAVRSSSPLEDVAEHSFDGIFLTLLNVPEGELVRAIYQVRKSAVSDKASEYASAVGVELDGRMPVIVQAMATYQTYTGVVYSKFPAPRNIVKVIRDTVEQPGKRYIEAFSRMRKIGYKGHVSKNPVLVSAVFPNYLSVTKPDSQKLADVALKIEAQFKHPVILEFSYKEEQEIIFNLLQARRLTMLSEAEKFQMPELQEKGLIASTYDLNGVGDFTGPAYVSYADRNYKNVDVKRMEGFDRKHKEGYVLIAPYIQFDTENIDPLTPHKKAVVAYTDLGKHHAMELSRKSGVLYFNCDPCFSQDFLLKRFNKRRKMPVRTGNLVRVVSDGEKGFVFNLSR